MQTPKLARTPASRPLSSLLCSNRRSGRALDGVGRRGGGRGAAAFYETHAAETRGEREQGTVTSQPAVDWEKLEGVAFVGRWS